MSSSQTVFLHLPRIEPWPRFCPLSPKPALFFFIDITTAWPYIIICSWVYRLPPLLPYNILKDRDFVLFTPWLPEGTQYIWDLGCGEMQNMWGRGKEPGAWCKCRMGPDFECQIEFRFYAWNDHDYVLWRLSRWDVWSGLEMGRLEVRCEWTHHICREMGHPVYTRNYT